MKSIKFVLFSRPLFTSNVSVILFVLWSINSVPLFFVPAACLILYFVKPFYNSNNTKIHSYFYPYHICTQTSGYPVATLILWNFPPSHKNCLIHLSNSLMRQI